MTSAKAWASGLVLGLVGTIVSAVALDYITLKTGYVLGFATILGGAIAGGGFGLGYRLAGGKLKSEGHVQAFMWTATGFGLFGVLTAYFGPYLLVAGIPLSLYLELIDFSVFDIVFIGIGAYGGRWAGAHLARSIAKKSAG